MVWTTLDKVLVGFPLLAVVLLVGWRGYGEYQLNRSANEIAGNVSAIADAVENYHLKTGRWFPVDQNEDGVRESLRIYIDIFYGTDATYQGLNPEWLWRERNSGIVAQLVRFDPDHSGLPVHLFASPLRSDQPYLRMLLDYGNRFSLESEIMMRVQSRLPEKAIAEVDDHYYVIDLRKLMNVEI